MATNLNLDDKLIRAVQKAGKHKTKKEAVEAALREYLARLAGAKLVALAGTIEMRSENEMRAMRGKPPIDGPFVLPPHLRADSRKRRAS